MLFGKRKKEPAERIPTDRVLELSSRGYPEGEIITALKNEGYRPREVDAAMREALRSSVRRMPDTDSGSMYPEEKLPRFRGYQEERNEPLPRPQKYLDKAPQTRKPITFPEHRQSKPDFWEDTGEGIPRLPEIPRPAARRQERIEPPPEELPEDEDDLDVRDLPPPPQPIEAPRIRRVQSRPEPLPQLDEDLEIPPIRPRQQRAPLPTTTRKTEEDIEDEFEAARRPGGMTLKIEDLEDRVRELESRIREMEQKKQTQHFDVYQDSIDELSGRLDSVESGLKQSLDGIMRTLKALAETMKDIKRQTTARKR